MGSVAITGLTTGIRLDAESLEVGQRAERS